MATENLISRQRTIADNKVSILLGDGDGTFGLNIDFATGTEPAGIAVGDFNGDGRPTW